MLPNVISFPPQFFMDPRKLVENYQKKQKTLNKKVSQKITSAVVGKQMA